MYEYPDMLDEDFQKKITAKKEFQDVKAIPNEPFPQRGESFRHQELLFRYAKQYDKMLVIWDPGVGKSCGMARITEYYKNLKDSPYKRVYFMARGTTLLEEFKHQLVCRCTKEGTYAIQSRKGLRKEKTLVSLKKAIDKLVKEYYDFQTVESFAKSIKDLSNKQLESEYSGSIFIIDEIHNLRIDPYKDWSGDDLKVPKETLNQTRMKNEEIYQEFWRLFHVVKRSKIFLLSATPMIDNYLEINPILNLLLPAGDDNQLNGFDWAAVSDIRDVSKYLQGLISYVRALDSGVQIVYQTNTAIKNIEPKPREFQGEQITPQNNVYQVEMSAHQLETYKTTIQGDVKVGPSVFSNQRQASDFVFPDGSFGKSGFAEYVEPVKERRQVTKKKKVEGAAPEETVIWKDITIPLEYKFAEELDEALVEPELTRSVCEI